MFDIDKYMHKPFFERECRPEPPCGFGPPPSHEKPRYTMTEEVEHTARLMRETIDRLLKFEERAKAELSDLSKNVMSDNVIFKNAMHESWTTFLMEVKNEINVFEANMESDVKMFKAEIESNYATLSEDVHNQIAENLATFEQKVADFEAKYEKEFTDLTSSIQEQYNAFVASVNQRIDNYNENTAQAFADFKRQMQAQLNTFEQTMEANYDNFTESVGNSIHEFRTNWEQIITERLAAQDAVISDAEMYMKTNLEHHVETLIGDMHANGEFIDIIEGEVFNDLESKSKLEYHHATTALGANVCAEFAQANNRVFYVPKGEVLEIEETLDLTGVDVEINGEIKIMHHGVGVIVGCSSRTGKVRNIVIRNVTHADYQDGDISVRVVGLMRGNVTIDNAPVVQVYADGDVDEIHAVGYSNFYIGTCRKLVLTDKPGASGLGWINENIFNVNRVTEELRIEGNTFAHDNNVFLKPCLEGAKLTLKNCVRNKFYDVRTEGNFSADFDENARYNYVLNNFHWASIQLASQVVDNGRNNVFTNSILESMEYVPFFTINEKTLDKFSIYSAEKFTVEDGKIVPSALYSKLIMDSIIPVDGVSFIGFEGSNGIFQLYVTPLDENKNPIGSGPLDYTGGVKQQDNGNYTPSDATSTAFIEIVNPAVKYLKITLDTCPTTVMPFEFVEVYALANKRNVPKLSRLREFFKV